MSLRALLNLRIFSGLLFSILCLFAYRHQTILPDSHYLKLKPSRFVLLCILIHSGTIFFMIPFSLNSPDQEFSLISLQSAYQSPPCDLWHPRLFIYWFGVWKVMVGYMIFLSLCSGLMVFFVAHSFRIIKVYQRITSKTTRKRQAGFLYALTLMVQIITDKLTALITNTSRPPSQTSACYSQTLFLSFVKTIQVLIMQVIKIKVSTEPVLFSDISDIIVCVVGLHGLLSTITMILSHKPYRNEAMALIGKLICWSEYSFFRRRSETSEAINVFWKGF